MVQLASKQRRIVTRTPGGTLWPVRLSAPGRAEIVATVHDYSVMGIGLVSPEPLKPGVRYVLHPAHGPSGLTPELTIEVRHSSPHEADDYLAGCRFSRLLTTDDIAQLG